MSEHTAPLPAALDELVDDFASVSARDRLQLLLELSDELPPLPDRYAGHAEAMEQVPECQSPLFLAVELDDERRGCDHRASRPPADSRACAAFRR